MMRRVHLVICFTALTLVVMAIALPVASVAADLPEAREVVDRYVAVIGGAERFLQHETVTTNGTFAMPAMGLQGTLSIWNQAPDKMLMEMEIPGYGKVRSGYDGEIGWMIDPAMGAQVLTNESLAQLRDEANFCGRLYRPADYSSLTVTGKAEFDSVACYQLAVVTTNGLESQQFFAVDSGLLVGVQQDQHTPMGKVPSTTVNKEYRDFDGLKIPAVIEQSTMGMQQVITIETVSFAPIDPAVFALPAEIAALVQE